MYMYILLLLHYFSLTTPYLWLPDLGVAQANPWVHPSSHVCCTLQATGTAQPGLALSIGE